MTNEMTDEEAVKKYTEYFEEIKTRNPDLFNKLFKNSNNLNKLKQKLNETGFDVNEEGVTSLH